MVELIAHRAGNSDDGVRSVEDLGVVVEADVHLAEGQLVVRHAKRLWPTRRLWDRWYLLPANTIVPRFDELLAWTSPDGPLWVDCKGVNPRLADSVVEATAERRPITLSTKAWWILRDLANRPGVRAIRSAGNRFELLLMRFLPSRVELDGVVVHSRLLTSGLVDDLRRRHGPVFTWAVDDVASAQRLVALGVTGLIIDDPSVLEALSDPGIELDDSRGDEMGQGEAEEG